MRHRCNQIEGAEMMSSWHEAANYSWHAGVEKYFIVVASKSKGVKASWSKYPRALRGRSDDTQVSHGFRKQFLGNFPKLCLGYVCTEDWIHRFNRQYSPALQPHNSKETTALAAYNAVFPTSSWTLPRKMAGFRKHRHVAIISHRRFGTRITWWRQVRVIGFKRLGTVMCWITRGN